MTLVEAAIGILLARAMLSPAHGRLVVQACRTHWSRGERDARAQLDRIADACEQLTTGGSPCDAATATGLPIEALSYGLTGALDAPASRQLLTAIVEPDAHAVTLALVVAACDPALVHRAVAGALRLDARAPALTAWAQKIDRHGARRSRLEQAAAAEVLAMVADDDDAPDEAERLRTGARFLLIPSAA